MTYVKSLLLVINVFLSVSGVLGQASSTGIIEGVASDQAGAVLSNASVVATNKSTGTVRSTGRIASKL